MSMADENVSLEGLKSLKVLNLTAQSGVNLHLMKQIAALRTLRKLDLYDTAVWDRGLHEIRGLVDLEELNVRGTLVTSEGLRELVPLRRLKRLSISPRLTPEIVDTLEQMPSLEYLEADWNEAD